MMSIRSPRPIPTRTGPRRARLAAPIAPALLLLCIGACDSLPKAPPPTASENLARSNDAGLRTRLTLDFPVGSTREHVKEMSKQLGLRVVHYQQYAPELDRADKPMLTETTPRFDVLLIADALPAYKDQDALPPRQRLVTFRFSPKDILQRIEVRPPKDPNGTPSWVIE